MYDNPYWEYHLPVNPPGAYLAEGDVMMTELELANWDDEGGYVFRPRLRDAVQKVERGPRAATDDEAPEIDAEWDCD